MHSRSNLDTKHPISRRVTNPSTHEKAWSGERGRQGNQEGDGEGDNEGDEEDYGIYTKISNTAIVARALHNKATEGQIRQSADVVGDELQRTDHQTA